MCAQRPQAYAHSKLHVYVYVCLQAVDPDISSKSVRNFLSFPEHVYDDMNTTFSLINLDKR